MQLSPDQKDAVTELVTIGYARAAAVLSELTGYRILLEVPNVDIFPIAEVGDLLSSYITGEVATVHQMFSGAVKGNALLLLDAEATALLKDVFMASSEFQGSSAEEILTEVGNIVLNACLGIFGNLLQVHVTFAVPRVHVDSLNRVLHSIIVVKEELHYGITIQTKFSIRDGSVSGYLVIVLGVTSLDRLILEVEQWAKRQAES